MKTKYLLSTLLGSAMLAACSVDDVDLAPVAQEANSSAPVFTVSFDNGNGPLTRAEMNPSTGHVGFAEHDLLSLYHGVQGTENETAYTKDGVSWMQYKYPSFIGWGNAIYEGEQNGENFDFTTKSMVVHGGAVLVWPADTKFENGYGDKAPRIRITADQTSATKDNTPYMSEILTIRDVDAYKPEALEGYDKTYDIVLKRVASTLKLTLDCKNELDWEALEVAPIVLKKVELASTGTAPFTISMPIKAEDTKSVAFAAPASSNSNKGVHLSWLNQSTLDRSDKTDVAAAINTTDIANNVATFTLLPKNTTDFSGNEIVGEGEGKIEVATTYGTVTITDDSKFNKEDVWTKTNPSSIEEDDEYPYTVSKGINSILQDDMLFAKASAGTFENEQIGKIINRTVTVNLGTLNMDNLHIADENILMDALKVYKYLSDNVEGFKKEVTFILDGDNWGPFVMHKTAWEAVVAQLGTSGNKVSFKPCTAGGAESCPAVRLVNDGTSAIEVPALQFAANSNAVVELEGQWKYTKSNTNIVDIKTLRVVNSSPASKLTLTGTVGAKNNSKDVTIDVQENGEVTVTNDVILNFNMTNHGTITIPEGKQLRMGANVNLTNCEATIWYDGDGNQITTGWDEGGHIDNYGTLAIVEQANAGTIYNYGVIKALHKNARTLVSKNESGQGTEGTAEFGELITSSNKIGSIYLFNKDDGNENTTVKDNEAQGFIKLELDQNSAEVKDGLVKAAVVGSVANYIIVGGNLEKIDQTVQTDGKVMYIEIQSTEEVVLSGDFDSWKSGTTTKGYEFSGLIVPAGKKAFIPSSSKISTKVLYLQGVITRAGSLSYNNTQTTPSYYGASNFKNINTY